MDVHIELKPRKTPGPSEVSLEEGNALFAPLLPPMTDGAELDHETPTMSPPQNIPQRVRTDEADFEQSSSRVNVTLPRMTLKGEPGDQAQHTLTSLGSTAAQDVQNQNSRESDRDSDVGEDETDAVSQYSVLEEHIIDAIESGDVSAVEHWLVEEGTDVNECRGGRASNGHFFVGDGTALHWAAYYGQLKIVNLLVSKGANPYEEARGGETVLHWACQCKEKNERVVTKLLTFSVITPDHPVPLAELPDSKGWTPLHYACYDNNMKLVLQLIEAKTDANAKNDDNFTPLHLLNKDSGEELDFLDPDHLLPRAKDPVLQENIIEKIKKGDSKRFQKWLNGKEGRVNCYRGGLATEGGLVVEGGTPLHWAAYYGQRDIVDALNQGNEGFRVLTSKKETILHWACKGQKTNEDLVKFLLKKVDVNFADVDGYTALHYACWRGNHDIAKLLLQTRLNKADRNAQALYGETPVGTAFRSGKEGLINLLDKDHLLPRDDDPKLDASIVEAIKDGDIATVEKKMNDGINRKRGGEDKSNDFEISGGTALHWAAYYGMVEIAILLLGREASPKVMDKNGETILHWACKSKRENVQMVKWLLKEHVTRRTLAGGDETKVQVDSTNSEGYTALHYACWQGHQKVTKLLKEAKADPRARSISGYIPLDFAVVGKKRNWGLAWMLDDRHLLPRAEFPRLEKCIIEGGYTHHVQKWLKSQRRNVDHCRDRREGGTALHWAAYHGRLDIVKLLIENGANPRARAYDNGTVLHWACRSEEGNRELVRLLRRKGCKLNDRDENGYTPFHLAASQGCPWVVEELLERDRFKAINSRVLKPEAAFKAKGNEGHTPLVKASLKGHHSVVNLLLKRSAIVEPQDLRAAIEEGNKHVVSDLLQSPQWPTLLRKGWEETTPFRELIKEMPDIAKQILDRCVVSNPETPDPKSKGYEVVLDYSFVEDHQNGNERSKRKTATKFPDVVRNSLTRKPKEVALEMDENPQGGHASEPKLYPEKKEEFHRKRFEEVQKQDGTMKHGPRFKKSNHPLDIMVQHDRLDMLTHPVIGSLLQYKWFHFGLWLYLLNLLLYMIFLVFLIAFALVVLIPQSSTCLQVFRKPGISVCDNETERGNSIGGYTAGSGHNSEMMAGDTAMNVTCVICELSGSTLRSVFAAIVILFALLHLLVKAIKLCHEPKKYIRNWAKLLVSFFEVSLYTLSIIFAFVFWTPCMCPLEWQWQIGVITVLLAWIYLIRIFAKIPSIGIYIIMFEHIVLTFLKVIFLTVLLLITFAITFWMTFSEAQFQHSPFYTPASSIVKVMSMTVGDFSFDEVFRKSPSGDKEDTEEILFPIISYLLWIIFLVIMPILFINLLIGLAVGDTNEIQEKARLTRLALQVDMILAAENLLHVLRIHKYFSTVPPPERVKPNATKEFSFRNIIYYLIFQELPNYYLEDSEPEDQNEMSYQMEQIVEDVKEHVLEAKQKHTEALERMEERMQALEQLIKEAILTNQRVLSDKET